MQNRWNDDDAAAWVERSGPAVGEHLALRVYTSRLIGADAALVLHGGGNTSVKTTTTDILGEPLEVIHVKGSGWDLGSIEAPGLPAVRLDAVRRLRELDVLRDEDMVNQVRIQLLESAAPTPSIEALLHAFLPHRFVDHTHADAILILTNQPDGAALVREALGDNVIILPWIMPGFPLAKAVAAAYEEQPDCEGIVLMQHGIFTFGDDGKSSYEAMIDLVDRAERFIEARLASNPDAIDVHATQMPQDQAAALAAHAMPIIRGAIAVRPAASSGSADGPPQRRVGQWRGAADLRAITSHDACCRLLGQGPLTPDHVIRTKGPYLFLSREQAADPTACAAAVQAYVDAYHAYFLANCESMTPAPRELDPMPRVVAVDGLGVFAFGADAKSAGVAGDIAEQTLRSKAKAEGIGRYTDLPPAELFAMEYWSLEQAKLGGKAPLPLCGQVALVTGAAGAIGRGIAASLLQSGAEVTLTDFDPERLERVRGLLADRFGASHVQAVVADVTSADDVRAAFDAACLRFGGVDIVVPNAGIAHVALLEEMDPDTFRKVVDVNLTGTMLVLREAARVYRAQGTGGAVVIQSSKNVFAPGAGFGAYSASKAGAHQLGKIAAMELAPLGVSVNMVNADAVFGDDDVPSGLWQEVGPDRMRSRGLDPQGLRDYYRDRSLLKREVRPEHVGEAVVFFATRASRTTGATLPIDAGIAAAFPR